MSTKMVSFHENSLTLTKKVFAILEYLMLQKEQVISAARLINHTSDSDADVFPDTLKYHIHAIKKKLAEAKCDKELPIMPIRNSHT
ncbi:winged helix-turn-helix domain-containing protein [Paenibacillus lignilyticus]|uniref:Winged helix-turn-helix transcriptional regulator n=1 Tax=Paenibacillus lignilyticus TaxID=1172615 RepID=A0ABS5CGT5_9BACL|nr:winged helix-turn-helix domain-containing protein [Paenibacillus lignilyticus]MBP3965050.1 winged helix-turn-helix transcriptional regulator [Paenibacillus lignilyticus]